MPDIQICKSKSYVDHTGMHGLYSNLASAGAHAVESCQDRAAVWDIHLASASLIHC